MGVEKIIVCDWPGCEKAEAVPTSILIGKREWDGYLCREHQEPFQVLLRPNRKRTDRDKVWTIEEIEALKRLN